jgi:hypothetical protein
VPPGSGWLELRELRHIGLTRLSTNYILTTAQAKGKPPVQIIDELVREKIAAMAE